MSMFSPEDHQFMSRALRLARRGLYTTDPNPRVGCVLVRDNEVVGESWHERTGEAHAEVRALACAGERARGATCYVTLEPCCHQGRTPPCARALIKAGIKRVVAAMEDPNPLVSGKGLEELKAAGILTTVGLMAAETEALNPGFIKRMRFKRPYVRCKLAMSLDGRTAMASGESNWITDAPARIDVQRLRARSSAMMMGIGTVLADDPRGTVRFADLAEEYPGGEAAVRQPLRVIVDPNLSLPQNARILSAPGRTLIVTVSNDDIEANLLRKRGAEIVRLPGSLDKVDLRALMDFLGSWEINEVLLETGAILSGSMLQAGLIDELIIYVAPLILGDSARGLFHLLNLNHLSDAYRIEIRDLRAIGKDWRIEATIQYSKKSV
ncbi:fused diaminohydroxyphosphoribosylaminopyrimidine deaminase/5-amino-6-(5-phosphoribosylamino)uracil reductase [Gammaproteobacteria bacterium]